MDTGYIDTNNSGTQATTAYRANAGNAITLKSIEFIPNLKRNISNEPEIGTNSPSPVNRGSLENLKFTLRCSITKTDSTEMNKIQDILELVSTNGYKLLWYDYTVANEANTESLLYQVASQPLYGDALTAGEQTAFSISSAFKTLHVVFTDLTFSDRAPQGTIKFDLKGIVLPVKTSVV